MAVMNLRTATLTVGTATLRIGEGNFTYTESTPMSYLTSGNEIYEVRADNEVPMDISFDFIWERSSSTFEAFIANLKGEDVTAAAVYDGTNSTFNKATGASSSDGNVCRPHACDIVVTYPKSCGDSPDSGTYTFPDFRWESLQYDVKAGTISCSGKSNATTPIIA